MASFQRNKDSDPDLDAKSKRCMERVSENLHILANEPSLAFYRLQEHVRKALPPTVEKRADVLQLNQQIQGRCYDADYAIGAVNALGKAQQPFENAKDLLKNCIFYRQQLKYEESRKQKKMSMYKRFSTPLGGSESFEQTDSASNAKPAPKPRPHSMVGPPSSLAPLSP